jgi:hypothetical protein
MVTKETLKARREEILRLARQWGARDVRVFGSVARGDAGPSSDVDFLVEFEPGRSLLDHGGLLMDLQDLLGCEVDVVSERGMRPRFRDRVLKEAVPLRDLIGNAFWTSSRRSRPSSATSLGTSRSSTRTSWYGSGACATSRSSAKLSQEVRDQAPNLPWKQIVGMRNTLIHAYFDVDWNEVWAAISRDIQPLSSPFRKFAHVF